ncbi:class I SAM-dependent methyltransferase [archaeon]|jgi:SAM-dependent methyltransferase|nr:class I SAM-dependent methyltransferase [archaeon]
MDDKKFVKAYKEDAKYYKTEKEVESIKLLNLRKESSLLDIGAGVGRLTLPLSKYFEVTALDVDERLIKEVRLGKIKKVGLEVLDYFPENKFSIVLLAYPNFGPDANVNKIIRHIKDNLLRKNGKLILIMGCDKSGKSKWLSDYKRKLNPYFKKISESFIETGYFYKNFKIAYDSTKFRDEVFRRKKLTNKDLNQLRLSLENNKDKNGNIYIPAFVKVMLYKIK